MSWYDATTKKSTAVQKTIFGGKSKLAKIVFSKKFVPASLVIIISQSNKIKSYKIQLSPEVEVTSGGYLPSREEAR